MIKTHDQQSTVPLKARKVDKPLTLENEKELLVLAIRFVAAEFASEMGSNPVGVPGQQVHHRFHRLQLDRRRRQRRRWRRRTRLRRRRSF